MGFLDVPGVKDSEIDDAVTAKIEDVGSAVRGALDEAILTETGEVFGLSASDGALNADLIEAAIAAAPMGIVTIPDGVWPTSRAIVVDKGVYIRGRGRVELVRAVFGTPVFDVLDALTPPTFENLTLTCTAARVDMPGSFRGGSANSYAAAIWTNSAGTTLRCIKGVGFTTALMIINWDTATGTRTGFLSDVNVDDLESTDCDWAVLGAGLKRLSMNKIHGTYSLRAGSADPSHLIYISDGSPNEDIIVTNCYTHDGTGGHAYQFKNVNGLEMSNMKARNCEGMFSLSNVQKMVASQISSIGDVAPSDGSIYIQGTGSPADLSMSDVFLDITNQNRAIRWDGTNGSLKNVEIRTVRTVSSDDYDVTIQGTGSVVENMRVINSGAGERRALGILAGTHRIINPIAKETKAVVTLPASAGDGNVVEYDPIASVRRAIAGARMVSTAGKLTSILRPKATRTAFATGGGEAVGIRADETTTAVVAISGATNFSVSAPIEPFNGATVTYEFTNTTAGAVGTITWNAAFVLSSALASPGAGLTTNIVFVYNGTKWVEERRV